MRFIIAAVLLVLSSRSIVADAFPVRGALPWHNFLEGPAAWDETDWKHYLDRMKELDLNLLVLHCYTGGAWRYLNYVEPMIRVSYRGVLPEARYDTSLTARWGYQPLRVRDFAFGTGKLFQMPPGAEGFGAEVATTARTNDERYHKAQALYRKVLAMAHTRGIRVAIGFEIGVYPPELFSIIPQTSYILSNMTPDPTHPASLEILRNTIDDILTAYPGVDQIWLWRGEHDAPLTGGRLSAKMAELLKRDSPLFEGANADTVFSGVWSLAFLRAAREYIRVRAQKVTIAISGWAGGNQLTPLLSGLDRALPTDVVFTLLNPDQGTAPHPPVLAKIAAHREVWSIPWLESDSQLWHLQPRVSMLRSHVVQANKDGLKGVIAIHWRTEEARSNMEAFARFAKAPDAAPSAAAFYEEYCRGWYGATAGKEIAALLNSLDEQQWFMQFVSPVYYPYDPAWGRMKPGTRPRLDEIVRELDALAGRTTDNRARGNILWLAANLRFPAQLDDVSQAIAPAWALREEYFSSAAPPPDIAARAALVLEKLRGAPIETLFRTFASRVRSRGELGELSSMNQRLWVTYKDMEAFLIGLTTKP